MRLRYDEIASMVVDVLVAAKGVDLSPCRRASGDKVGCLIVAEAREYGVLAGKIVVEADVGGSFIEPSHGLVHVVVAWVVRVGRRIKRNQFCADRVNQACWNLIARNTARLYSPRCRKRITSSIAFKSRAAIVRIREVRKRRLWRSTSQTERIERKIAAQHRGGRNQSCERHTET